MRALHFLLVPAKAGTHTPACGVSSTLWPIASIIGVSRILDRPPERAMTVSAVIPGRCEASNPESRDSGSGPSDHPGMTESQLSVASLLTKPRVWRASIPDTTSRPRGAMRPSRAFISRPKGVGNAGCPLHPQPRVHLVLVESTRVTTSTPESPGIPARNGFNGFLRALPGDRAVLPPSLAD
jgi:hypothetical protein